MIVGEVCDLSVKLVLSQDSRNPTRMGEICAVSYEVMSVGNAETIGLSLACFLRRQ